MLSANLWVEVGLVNGALGTVEAICYDDNQQPPDLPIAVMVKFDTYAGPTLPDGTVPIAPLRRTLFTTTKQCSRLQVPLKFAWAVTIHKSQGLTLDKAVIDIGKKEFSTGLTFVACSRVRQLSDLLFMPPFSFQRVANLSKSARLKGRLLEDARLHQMSAVAYKGNWSSSTLSPQQQVPCQLPPTPLSPPTPPPEPAALSPLQMPTTTLHFTERQPSCDIEMTESAHYRQYLSLQPSQLKARQVMTLRFWNVLSPTFVHTSTIQWTTNGRELHVQIWA